MHTTRRLFLKTAALLGTGLAAGTVFPANLYAAARTNSLSLGVCTGLQNAEMLSKLGYSFIEAGVRNFLVPDKPEAEFLANLEASKKSPLPVTACNSFLPGDLKSVGPEAVHNEILEFAETAFRRAQMAGVKTIVFGSGGSRRIPDNFTRQEALGQFVDLCSSMAPVAQKYSVVIVLEPLNRNECNFINSLSQGAEIVNAVNHRNFRLLADIYHMKMDDEGPGEIEKFGNIISHAHIAEKEGRAAPGTNGEDFVSYFAALLKTGYSGELSVESRWENMESQAAVAFRSVMEQWSTAESV
jgi:sugar phosphate isomerase/epimerase